MLLRLFLNLRFYNNRVLSYFFRISKPVTYHHFIILYSNKLCTYKSRNSI